MKVDPLIIVALHPTKMVVDDRYLGQRFGPFVDDELATSSRSVLVAHPGSETPCPVDVTTPTTIVLGPEGGFAPAEVERLRKAGATFVELGPRILRVETAVVAAVARLGGR